MRKLVKSLHLHIPFIRSFTRFCCLLHARVTTPSDLVRKSVFSGNVTRCKPDCGWDLLSFSPTSHWIWSNPSPPLLAVAPLLPLCHYSFTPHTYTFSPPSRSGVPATDSQSLLQSPQQQGGNDPATTAVMMESVGGFACSLTPPNKSLNNSVYISADPATRSNTLTPGLPPHVTLGQTRNCSWLPHDVLQTLHGASDMSPWLQELARRTQP